ncbi:MAG TPA: M20/M25/M40 family metallo-hydrolase [Candidatus Saccharimonadales bacterium]|nr:M20/M25/M40 family metallo-hydrolase [Candidatus Saccharimonadales bacterium]
MSISRKSLPVLAALLLMITPAAAQNAPKQQAAGGEELSRAVEAALRGIGGREIEAHVDFLASDHLQGRGTGQLGGEIAADYIGAQFQLMGLGAPVPTAAKTTSYFQDVPLVGVNLDPNQSIVAFSNDTETFNPKYLDEAVYWTESQKELAEASGPVIFVGYGIVAPQYGWDDFKDVDVTGKIVMMLVNDPPSDDPNFFGGKALTYYGRWTYKLYVAAEKGAAGALLIHTPDMAGYGWDVVKSSWGKEQDYNPLDPEGPPPLKIAAWLSQETASKVIQMGHQDLTALMEQSKSKDFRPIPLDGVELASRLTSKVRNFNTRNVIAFYPGSDPAKNAEFVVYTAHYDHLGIGRPVDGDDIYNGAEDNATGVAALLEIARTYTRRSVKPRRSVLFIATAAEEEGLLGSAHFTDRHNLFIYPGRFAADVNLDGLSPLGESTDYVFLGADRSPQLTKVVNEAAQQLGFTIEPDPHPEKGHYFRSDQFNFARLGVPSISVKNGDDYKNEPPGWGEEKYQEYLTKKYHQPSDQVDSTWDFDGLAHTAGVAWYIGYLLTTEDELPMWNEKDEFASERKEALAELADLTQPPPPSK